MGDLRLLPKTNTVHDQIVQRLEELLADARAGNVSAIALVTIDRDKDVVVYAKYESKTMMLGAVAMLQADLLAVRDD